MNRLSLFSLLIAGTALFAGASCTASQLAQVTEVGMVAAGQDPEAARRAGQAAGQVAGSFAPMPFETERAIGGSIALQSLVQQGNLHPSEELQQYVSLVGRSVAEHSSRNGFPFAFAVVDREDVNAWAAPGGYVFVTAGLLKEMEDEAQLAGVLGHEIAHVTQAHMLTTIRRTQRLAGLADLSESALGEDMSTVRNAVNQGTDTLFNKGLDQNMEFEADLVGMEYAALTGYDPSGIARYLRALQARAGERGGGWLASTHPPLTRRIQRVEAALQTNFAGIEGAVQQDRYRETIRRTLGE